MEVSESCETEMCMWDRWCAARPEGSEGGEGDGVREPGRKESSGSLYLVLFTMLLSETGGLPFCF